jgi:hypothetical protein
MSAPRTCSSCSAPLEEGVSFCSECGAKLQAPQKASAGKHTMLGISPEALAALTRAAADASAKLRSQSAAADDDPQLDAGRRTDTGISEPPRGQMGRTVLGMTPPPATVSAAVAKAAEQRRGPGPASAGGAAKPLAKTMFGVGGVRQPPPAAQGPQGASGTLPTGAGAGAKGGKPGSKTLFAGGPLETTARMAEGRSTPLVGTPVPAAQQNAQPAAAPAPVQPRGSGRAGAGDLARTHFGSADTPVAPEAAPAGSVGPEGSATPPAHARGGSHTLLGLEDDAPPADDAAARPPSAAASTSFQLTGASASVWDRAQRSSDHARESYVKAESTVPPVRSGISPAKLLLVAVLLLAAGALAVLSTLRRGPEVQVRVASEAGRDTLEFEVPGAVGRHRSSCSTPGGAAPPRPSLHRQSLRSGGPASSRPRCGPWRLPTSSRARG